MPPGQSQDIPQADPRGRVTPWFWHRLIRFRRFCSGSLALASLDHTVPESYPRRFRNVHHRRFWRPQLAVVWDQHLPNSKGPPSSLVQLRFAVWTGVTRDTRPIAEVEHHWARAVTWPPSPALLMKREASGRCQPLGWGGTSPQPP